MAGLEERRMVIKNVVRLALPVMTYVMFIYFFPQQYQTDGEKRTITPCEIAVKSVIPAVKALMAKQLVQKHGLKQDQVAKILGISQSAVSKYTCKVRGCAVKIDNIDEIQPLMDKMITLLVNETYDRKSFLAFFCQTCVTIRKTSLMCSLCQRTEPAIKATECGFCLTDDSCVLER